MKVELVLLAEAILFLLLHLNYSFWHIPAGKCALRDLLFLFAFLFPARTNVWLASVRLYSRIYDNQATDVKRHSIVCHLMMDFFFLMFTCEDYWLILRTIKKAIFSYVVQYCTYFYVVSQYTFMEKMKRPPENVLFLWI